MRTFRNGFTHEFFVLADKGVTSEMGYFLFIFIRLGNAPSVSPAEV